MAIASALAGECAREDRVERRVGVRARPPDQLDGNGVAIARDALRRPALLAPGAEVGDAAARREQEAVSEVDLALGHDQHLDVGDVVRDTAGDAPRQHDFFDRQGSASAIPCATERSSRLRAVAVTRASYVQVGSPHGRACKDVKHPTIDEGTKR